MDSKIKMFVMGYGWQTKVSTLNEQVAVELGAEILGEAVVFLFLATGLVIEYSRSSAKARAKEEELLKRIDNLENKLQETLVVRTQTDEKLKRVLDELRLLHENLYAKKKNPTKKPSELTNDDGGNVSSGSRRKLNKRRRVTLEKSDVLGCSSKSRQLRNKNYSADENSSPFLGVQTQENNVDRHERGLLRIVEDWLVENFHYV